MATRGAHVVHTWCVHLCLCVSAGMADAALSHAWTCTCGLPMRAMATLRRRRMPPEKVPAGPSAAVSRRERVREREEDREGGWERERQRKRKGARQRERERQTKRDGDRWRERETTKKRERERERESERERERETERQRDRETDSERERERQGACEPVGGVREPHLFDPPHGLDGDGLRLHALDSCKQLEVFARCQVGPEGVKLRAHPHHAADFAHAHRVCHGAAGHEGVAPRGRDEACQHVDLYVHECINMDVYAYMYMYRAG